VNGRAILFVGPSLWGSRRDLPHGIEARPPASCGDVLRAATERPVAIGLIDGLFESGPSVWHKELLAVVALGVPVLGAASLGALRAAELDRLGMIGIGDIYAAYRDGRLIRDDAVMVSHAPAALGHRPLTVALVDAVAAIDAAAGPIEDKALLGQIAGRMNFRDRTWPAMKTEFTRRTGRVPPPCDEAASLKQRDAEALVDRLATYLIAFNEPLGFDAPGAARSDPRQSRGEGGLPEATQPAGTAAPICPAPPETVFLRALRGRISS
jgi:hypothetical protein